MLLISRPLNTLITSPALSINHLLLYPLPSDPAVQSAAVRRQCRELFFPDGLVMAVGENKFRSELSHKVRILLLRSLWTASTRLFPYCHKVMRPLYMNFRRDPYLQMAMLAHGVRYVPNLKTCTVGQSHHFY
jgi:hypothetical protein